MEQAPPNRVASIDILRGIVIALMALDHVREYFHAPATGFDPLDFEQTNPALYATRWVTHFCAPVFAFLAGTSAFLQSQRKTKAGLSRFLATRGLMLVVLEMTLIGFGWSFRFDFLFMGVIWSLGVSMIALSALVWLPWRAVLAIAVLIVAGHNLLDPLSAEDLGPLWGVLHEQSPILVGDNLVGFFLYPVLPWIGVMALGFGLGPIFTLPGPYRRRVLLLIGAILVALFVILRVTGVYGDPFPWNREGGIMTFLSTAKYPPSLQFVCMTLGPALILLPFLEQLRGRWAQPWITFGAVPFFFYVTHIYLAHALNAGVRVAMMEPIFGIADQFQRPERVSAFGYSLAGAYLVWLFVLTALYIPCRWFARLKREKPGGLLSYL